MDWIGLDWIGLDWIGLDLDWIGLDWIGLDWIGLDWIGLDWIGLDFGLDWIGLDWIGLGFWIVKVGFLSAGKFRSERSTEKFVTARKGKVPPIQIHSSPPNPSNPPNPQIVRNHDNSVWIHLMCYCLVFSLVCLYNALPVLITLFCCLIKTKFKRLLLSNCKHIKDLVDDPKFQKIVNLEDDHCGCHRSRILC